MTVRTVGVAVIGFGWMGRVHAQAHARVRHHFPDLGVVPELVAVADDVPGRAEAAAEQFGAARATRDWREGLDDPRGEAGGGPPPPPAPPGGGGGGGPGP